MTIKKRANKGQTKGNIKEYKEEQEEQEDIYKGFFNNVKLSKDEYMKLKEQFQDYEEKIDNLSGYIASKGDKYKSHYLTILNWSRKDKKKEDNLPHWYDKDFKKDEKNLDELEKVLEDFN